VSVHSKYVFMRAMRQFSALPHNAILPRPILSDLLYGWGYESGSIKHEYASAVLQCAWIARGPILECGSGLSTILLGLVAERTGNEVWSLEHDTFWVEKVSLTLKRHNISSVRLCQSDLRNYGAYLWYDPPKDRMPKDFSRCVRQAAR
jgi:hypothetical protein